MTYKMSYFGWTIMMLLALAIGLIAPAPYFYQPPEDWLEVFRQPSDIYRAALMTHALFSGLALIIGPFQFLPQFRQRNIMIHRWLGRIYLGCILIGGLTGLYVAQFSFAGLTATVGFSMLACLWLLSGGLAYQRIRQGQINRHQEWLIRNYALTFAAVTLRLWIPLGMVMLMPSLDTRFHGDEEALFKEVYLVVPWLCWVPNLLLAEVMIHYKREF